MTSRPLRRAVVALGSNIEPERWVPWAIARLQARFRDVLVSTAYRAAAVGPPGQPPFVNAVVVLATDLPLPALRAALRHRVP
ncbi:MAG: 2-amino-4-hydroxy-6-hydroxymethyldihydropteridine diphosphokinase [Planctomycetes bacterium]|nr:2-amino-4-hydroxy-6-hydroxymethyldihydropteridine diphosphokinase [Planctomycetota bacterium]